MRVEDCPTGSGSGSGVKDSPLAEIKSCSAALVVVPDIISCLRGTDDFVSSHLGGRDSPDQAPNVKLQHLLRHLSGEDTPSKRMRTQFMTPGRAGTGFNMSDVSTEMLMTVEAFLSGVLDACVPLVQKGTPIVLLLTCEVIDFNLTLTSGSSHVRADPHPTSAPASFDEVSGDVAHRDHLLVLIFKELLCRRSGMAVTNIKESFFVRAKFLNSDLYNTRGSELFATASSAVANDFSELSSVVSLCGKCLFTCLDRLALATSPLPLVERVDVATWAEEVMLDALWRTSNNMKMNSHNAELTPTDGGNYNRSNESDELVVAGPNEELSVKSVLGSLVKNVNMALNEVCVSRVMNTYDAILASQENHHCLYPFDLNVFSSSNTIGTDDVDGVYGSCVVKGLLYNNMSDRMTASCGPISSSLPVYWDQADYLASTLDSMLEVLSLPSLKNNEDVCGYSDVLLAQGWRVDSDLKSRLDEVLTNLQFGLEALRMVAPHLTSHVSWNPGFKSDIRDQWTIVNLNILTLKRLLGRAIQLQCAEAMDHVLQEDVYLLVPPAELTSHSAILRADTQVSTDQFLLPACPLPFSLLDADGDTLGADVSRCKRRHPQDNQWEDEDEDEDEDDELEGGRERVESWVEADDENSEVSDVESTIVQSSLMIMQGSGPRGGKKKCRVASRATASPNTHTYPRTCRHVEYEREVYGEVRQLGNDCRREVQESLDLEDKIARALLEDGGGSFGSKEGAAECGLWSPAERAERLSYLMLQDGKMQQQHYGHQWLGSDDETSVVDSFRDDDDENQNDDWNVTSKENRNINSKSLTASSVMDMINRCRDERRDSDAWLKKMS